MMMMMMATEIDSSRIGLIIFREKNTSLHFILSVVFPHGLVVLCVPRRTNEE